MKSYSLFYIQVLTIDLYTINSMKEEFGYEWEEVLNRLFKNVEESVETVINHITAVEMAKKKILKNRNRRKLKVIILRGMMSLCVGCCCCCC